jgi:hypothetical protein
MNTVLSGSGRVDDIKGHPQSEVRGLTKLVKITEDVRKFAAVEEGLKQKATESRCGDAARWTGSPKGKDAGAAESIQRRRRGNLREGLIML